jgi:hypothetical protein
MYLLPKKEGGSIVFLFKQEGLKDPKEKITK